MKTLKVLAVAFIALVATLSMKAESENFEIEAAANSSASSELNVYHLTSETMNIKFSVEVKEVNNGTNFVVKGKGFEVLYRLRGNRFGVWYVNDGESTIAKDEMYTKLDRKSFLHQRVITNNPKSEKQYVQLIAAYLPDLMK